jgi:lysophospholipase L1-like esterase
MTHRHLRPWSHTLGALAVMVALAGVPTVVPTVGPTVQSLPRPTVQPLPGGPVRILPLGASITYGYEYGSYRARLWDLLTADGYEIDFVGSLNNGPGDLPDRDHEGHRGWRIGQIEERAAGWVDEHDPDVVLLHIGTNDLVQGASAQEAASSMDSLLDTLTTAKPEMAVIVSTLIPLHAGDATWRETNAAFARLVAERAAAGERVLLADMGAGGPQAGDQIPDGVHPSGEGYALMAQVWHPVVVKALGGQPGRTPAGTGERDPAVERIALSSDGNQHDEDDWAASAMGLAILAHVTCNPTWCTTTTTTTSGTPRSGTTGT